MQGSFYEKVKVDSLVCEMILFGMESCGHKVGKFIALRWNREAAKPWKKFDQALKALKSCEICLVELFYEIHKNILLIVHPWMVNICKPKNKA